MSTKSQSRALRGFNSGKLVPLLVPAVLVAGACGTPPGTAPPGGKYGFGDSGTGSKDSGHSKTDGTTHLGDGGADARMSHDTGSHDGEAAGTLCSTSAMCASGVCSTGQDAGKHEGGVECDSPGCVCQAPSCDDSVKNGTETDVDCGGDCPACPDHDSCTTGMDCQDKVCGLGTKGLACTPGDAQVCVCEVPTCTDGVQNEGESAVDCGGTKCKACTTGKACAATTDCISGVCTGGLCSCPAGMIEATTSLMIPYCIDAYEVTKAQYQTFLDQNILPSTQATALGSNICNWNTTFAPSNNFPPLPEWAPNPITDVNWCDAFMYCANTGGKHLCGHIVAEGIHEGDPISQTNGDANSPTADEWYNACSDQGANTYPYGSTYHPEFCNGAESPAQSPQQEWKCQAEVPTQLCCNSVTPNFASPYATVQANETLAFFSGGACQSPPDFSEPLCIGGVVNTLFDMSGNVQEWENSCSAVSGASDTCNVRGGSYLSAQAQMSCKNTNQPPLARNTSADDVGFRCCL